MPVSFDFIGFAKKICFFGNFPISTIFRCNFPGQNFDINTKKAGSLEPAKNIPATTPL